MRSALRIVFLVAILAGLAALESCKKKPGPGESIEDQQLGKLSKTWKVTSVKKDNVDLTGDYVNFTLIISGTAGATSFGYSRSGATQLNPWPSSGNWSFGANPTSDIIRDKDTADELPLTYSVDETQLRVEFSYNGAGYPAGRTSNVKGSWIFEFGL
ncbi:MAG: hypothetical protein AB7K37_11995 [Cyclobacteriaceae bacterium]